MYEKLFHQILSLLRRNLGTDECVMLACQLIAWVRLSQLGRLDDALSFTLDSPPRDAKRLAILFQEIWESGLLEKNGLAFSYVSPALQYLSAGQMLQILETLAGCTLDEPWEPESMIPAISEKIGKGFFTLPAEIAKLMVSLAEIRSYDSVYLPFEEGFQLTATAQKLASGTYSETRMTWPFPWLLNLLSGLKMEIEVGDCLERPGYLDRGELVQFGVSLAFPPIGVRYDPELIQKNDLYGRFPEKTSSSSVLTVRHLLACTRRRIVVAVPNSFLFTPGAERSLRDDLLEKRQIEAVISLPSALLQGTAYPFSILVLRSDHACDEILFVDGSDESFSTKDGKGRTTLTGWQEVVDAVLTGKDSPTLRKVSVEEVQANDAHLQVSRYCKSPEALAVEEKLGKYQTQNLDNLMEIVRPILPIQQEGTVSVREFGPVDFPEFGYAQNPGRTIKLSEQVVLKQKKQFLRPFDIAIVIKGNVGKVAIFPPETPEGGEDGWIIGPSCIILRIADKQKIDPRVVFFFLKSELGQAQLRQVVSGATVALIQIKELQNMRIPLPDRVKQEEIIGAFEKIVEIEQTVADFRGEQRRLSSSIWGNPVEN